MVHSKINDAEKLKYAKLKWICVCFIFFGHKMISTNLFGTFIDGFVFAQVLNMNVNWNKTRANAVVDTYTPMKK